MNANICHSFSKATQSTLTTTITNVQCHDSIISDTFEDNIYIYTNGSCGYYGCEGWYHNRLQGGRRQMTTFDNLPYACKNSLVWDWNYFVVALKGTKSTDNSQSITYVVDCLNS